MKPLILAVDTTREFGSLALLRGSELLDEVSIHAPSGFAHVLYGAIGALLAAQQVKTQDIDCYAAASGPGSFTGVRIGLACIKGLAEAASKPAVAVSNLQALAAFGNSPLRAPVMDARRGEIYGAVYDAQCVLVAPETVGPLEAWVASLPEGVAEFIAADPGLPLPEGSRVVPAPRSIASAVARLASEVYSRGEASDPAALDANYVRRPDIRTNGL